MSTQPVMVRLTRRGHVRLRLTARGRLVAALAALTAVTAVTAAIMATGSTLVLVGALATATAWNVGRA